MLLSLPFLISSAIPIKSCWNSFWGQGVYSSGTECLSKGPMGYTHICIREYYQISSHTCKSIHLYPALFLIQHSQWGSPVFSICIVCVWLWFVFPPLHKKKKQKKNEVAQIVSQNEKLYRHFERWWSLWWVIIIFFLSFFLSFFRVDLFGYFEVLPSWTGWRFVRSRSCNDPCRRMTLLLPPDNTYRRKKEKHYHLSE